MNIVSTPEEFDQQLQSLLDEYECLLVSSRHLAQEVKVRFEECRIYDVDTGRASGLPFFTYIVDNGTAVFLFDGDPFLVYVFRCDPHELITYVEAEFTTEDVEACKQYITALLGKRAAIAASAEIAYQWLANAI